MRNIRTRFSAIQPALVVATLAVCSFSVASWSEEPPAFTKEQASNVLFWSQEQRDWGFRNIDKILPVRHFTAAQTPYPLPRTLQDLSNTKVVVEGSSYSITETMSELNIAGLLVVNEGTIVFEKYGLGNDENSKWISFSVTKSVSSMLIGAAIQDGFIASVDDPVTDYLPRLKGSSYDQATIRNVLNMASGIAWNEDYADPKSDVARAGGLNAMDLFAYLNTLPIASKPGEVFNYNTGETNLVGAIVRAAVGDNQSSYLERKIWKPFGMESDAYWNIDARYAAELGGCCINATLRDYARIGLFAMSDGVLPDGTRILPEGWMEASTAPSKGYEGYGYLWWLMPDEAYAALGIFGQMIWINPATETVIAIHSSWPAAVDRELGTHRMALVQAIESALVHD